MKAFLFISVQGLLLLCSVVYSYFIGFACVLLMVLLVLRQLFVYGKNRTCDSVFVSYVGSDLTLSYFMHEHIDCDYHVVFNRTNQCKHHQLYR